MYITCTGDVRFYGYIGVTVDFKLTVNSGAHYEIPHYYLSLINSAALVKFEGFIMLLLTDSSPVSFAS
jgi:hypothetical protein